MPARRRAAAQRAAPRDRPRPSDPPRRPCRRSRRRARRVARGRVASAPVARARRRAPRRRPGSVRRRRRRTPRRRRALLRAARPRMPRSSRASGSSPSESTSRTRGRALPVSKAVTAAATPAARSEPAGRTSVGVERVRAAPPARPYRASGARARRRGSRRPRARRDPRRRGAPARRASGRARGRCARAARRRRPCCAKRRRGRPDRRPSRARARRGCRACGPSHASPIAAIAATSRRSAPSRAGGICARIAEQTPGAPPRDEPRERRDRGDTEKGRDDEARPLRVRELRRDHGRRLATPRAPSTSSATSSAAPARNGSGCALVWTRGGGRRGTRSSASIDA